MVIGAGLSRAYIIREGDAVRVRLRLSRHIRVKAGQYVGLWIPAVSFWAPLQSHPFMVTSWSAGRSKHLDIVVEPRKGWTRSLADLGRVNEQLLRDRGMKDTVSDTFVYKGLISNLALFTGPHGCSVPVGEYETVVMIASDFGIAAQLPYLHALVYSYNACKTRNRRVHLIWFLEKYNLIPPFVSLLNAALDNDSLDEGFILSISIHITASDMQDEQLGRRVNFYYRPMPLEQILKEEHEGKYIRKVQTEDMRSRDMAVLVSATGSIQDLVRKLILDRFKKGVTLFDLDY
ncbi:hypothetical protein CC86DRAFT_183145 [Ophiobolus disseminans]|uniref:ferric-chelate reductase (NADPH) n=1 Tax=Ophiobolus disseminans TaxID=1469910 RepID=A0A6A6ZCK8_9PLEO|nr:hypothetical protein CC86DRAFT_183145 [Ophiobolus disseminans]